MDGILVVNKEKGCTSHDVVYKVKKLFGTKVGHTWEGDRTFSVFNKS